MYSRLSICIFVSTPQIVHSLTELLSGQRYQLHIIKSPQELNKFVLDNKEKLDCMIISADHTSIPVIKQLDEEGVMLPVIILDSNKDLPRENQEDKINLSSPEEIYHSGEVHIQNTELNQINTLIDKAISQFLHLAPSCSLNDNPRSRYNVQTTAEKHNFLLLQQKRLAEKLKERLGYLGVYYKRNPNSFYRHLSSTEKEELINSLSQQYRDIILDYFSQENEVNKQIDEFVNQAFFTDLSISQILEIHMELMDEFAQQLKLEGRNEDILLDYRLALIDLIAHLCEMYRRSIPKEDIPFEMLFTVD